MKLRLALATAAFGVTALLGLTACQHGLAGTSAGAADTRADSGQGGRLGFVLPAFSHYHLP